MATYHGPQGRRRGGDQQQAKSHPFEREIEPATDQDEERVGFKLTNSIPGIPATRAEAEEEMQRGGYIVGKGGMIRYATGRRDGAKPTITGTATKKIAEKKGRR